MGLLASYLRLRETSAQLGAKTDVKSSFASMQDKLNTANAAASPVPVNDVH
jgi:hypothetical protein